MTMTLQQKAEASALVHRVIGFARMGTMPHQAVATSAADRLEALADSEVMTPESVQVAREVLANLRAGVLPTVQRCSDAMDEVNEFRLPLNRQCRSERAGAAEAPQAPRERG